MTATRQRVSGIVFIHLESERDLEWCRLQTLAVSSIIPRVQYMNIDIHQPDEHQRNTSLGINPTTSSVRGTGLATGRSCTIRGGCLQPHYAGELTYSYCNRWHPKKSPKDCFLLAYPPCDSQKCLPSTRWSLSSADNAPAPFLQAHALTSTNQTGIKAILLPCSIVQRWKCEKQRSGNGETLHDSWWLDTTSCRWRTPTTSAGIQWSSQRTGSACLPSNVTGRSACAFKTAVIAHPTRVWRHSNHRLPNETSSTHVGVWPPAIVPQGRNDVEVDVFNDSGEPMLITWLRPAVLQMKGGWLPPGIKRWLHRAAAATWTQVIARWGEDAVDFLGLMLVSLDPWRWLRNAFHCFCWWLLMQVDDDWKCWHVDSVFSYAVLRSSRWTRFAGRCGRELERSLVHTTQLRKGGLGGWDTQKRNTRNCVQYRLEHFVIRDSLLSLMATEGALAIAFHLDLINSSCGIHCYRWWSQKNTPNCVRFRFNQPVDQYSLQTWDRTKSFSYPSSPMERGLGGWDTQKGSTRNCVRLRLFNWSSVLIDTAGGHRRKIRNCVRSNIGNLVTQYLLQT